MYDVAQLFDLVKDPAVSPFVRENAATLDQYYFVTKQSIEAEQNGKIITRTILNENHQPIGIISLLDINNNTGFLATWIGQPYFGKGYNQTAKVTFLNELFSTTSINRVFLKIRKSNVRSLKANKKLAFMESGNTLYPTIHATINHGKTEDSSYELFVISKESYCRYYPVSSQEIIS